jgi:hypothetical protein
VTANAPSSLWQLRDPLLCCMPRCAVLVLIGGGGGRRGCYQMVCFLRAKQPDVPCAEKGFKKEVLLERVRAVIIATLAPGAPLPPAV